MSDFAEDVRIGLTSTPKRLSSKYFYDAEGDALFCSIMACPEYYLTDCEMEIFTTQSDAILDVALANSRVTAAHVHDSDFEEATIDVVELGPGDASKSVHLLRALVKRMPDTTYYPVDISSNIIALLESELPAAVPGIRVRGRQGDFAETLHDITSISERNKLILFLGSTIGNLTFSESRTFFAALRSSMREGDMLLVGFDLQKDPSTILAAYNDSQGVTRAFNLNLLARMNRELGATFDLDTFEHFPVYDPVTGTCKSFVYSCIEQTVRIEMLNLDVHFHPYECIHTEVSQKYTKEQIDLFAREGGFESVQYFTDSRGWFVDALFFA